MGLCSPGKNFWKEGSLKNIFTGNLISNSFLQGNIGERMSLHVFLLGAFFLAIFIIKK
jgi:hypothetical protein